MSHWLGKCVLAEPEVSAGSDRDVGDEVNGLVERASPHLTSEECRQLQTAMAARKHLFAKGKGDLGLTDIVNPFNPIRPYLASIEPLPINMTIFLRLFDDYI